MNNQILLSIIVPVYNIEKYLCQCVDSILAQSCNHYELILVNDGSTDASPAICNQYASGDSRIKIVQKENGGLSDARNAGIHAASGEYLLFIDGDDFIATDSLTSITNALYDDGFPDVLFLTAFLYYDDGKMEPYGYGFKKDYFFGKDKQMVLSRLSMDGQFHVSACFKAIKRKLIESNGIFFTKDIIGEDVDFSIRLYLNAATYSYLNRPYYYYRQNRADSIMAQKKDKRFNDLMFIIEKWTALSDSEFKEYGHWVSRFLFHQYYVLILLYKDINKDLKTKETKKVLRRFSYLLKHTDNKKSLLLYVFYCIFGLNCTSYLLNLFEGMTDRLSSNEFICKAVY